MKKTVAIIGAVGIVGAPIALGLATAGYRILLADDIRNHPLRYMKLSWLERRILWEDPQADVEMAVSRREASWEADIIIPAVPYVEQAGVASRIRDVVTGKIIVSLGVLPGEMHDRPSPSPAASAAGDLARLLPYSKIVEVVSTIFATRRGEGNAQGKKPDVYVAGDDRSSVETVMQLVEDAGFHPVAAVALRPGRNPAGAGPKEINAPRRLEEKLSIRTSKP